MGKLDISFSGKKVIHDLIKENYIFNKSRAKDLGILLNSIGNGRQ